MLGSPEGRAGNSDATEVNIDDLFLGLARHVPALVHTLRHLLCTHRGRRLEAESKEKYGAWDTLPGLTIQYSPLVSLQHIYQGQLYARIDFIPQSGT
jgi:hypothetical protein